MLMFLRSFLWIWPSLLSFFGWVKTTLVSNFCSALNFSLWAFQTFLRSFQLRCFWSRLTVHCESWVNAGVIYHHRAAVNLLRLFSHRAAWGKCPPSSKWSSEVFDSGIFEVCVRRNEAFWRYCFNHPSFASRHKPCDFISIIMSAQLSQHPGRHIKCSPRRSSAFIFPPKLLTELTQTFPVRSDRLGCSGTGVSL